MIEMIEYRYEVFQIAWERVFLRMAVRERINTKELDFENSSELSYAINQIPGDYPAESDNAFYLERLDDLSVERKKSVKTAKVQERIALSVSRVEEEEGGNRVFHFCCNLAAFKGREFLNNGTWRLIACQNGASYICYASHELAYRFEELSRIFRYGKKQYAYSVSFKTFAVADEELAFLLESFFMKNNKDWKHRHYVEEARTFSGKRKRAVQCLVMLLIRLYYRFVRFFYPKNGNHILLMSETHGYLWGNLKALDEAIKRLGLDRKYKVQYSFREAVGHHQSAFSWIKLIHLCAGQDYIFVDDYVPVFGFLDLDKDTKLIQVWHAGLGFKAVGYSRFGKDASPFPCGSCHKKYDYVLTGSESLVTVFSEVFGIEEEAFLPVGMPRMDRFLDEDYIKKVKTEFYGRFPQLRGKKIILFAPTFRGAGQGSAYYKYSWIDWQSLYEFCGENTVVLLKMHPFVKKLADIPNEYQDRIIEFSWWPHINDLYYVTDILITDYSSNYYEFSLLHRPCVFFTPDRELYELNRGVHRGVKESAPGKVCDTFEELLETLKTEDFELEKVEAFVNDNFGNYDGKSAEKAIRAILMNE